MQRAEERNAKAEARLATAIKNWNEMETKRKELEEREAMRYGATYPRGWFDLSVISADET